MLLFLSLAFLGLALFGHSFINPTGSFIASIVTFGIWAVQTYNQGISYIQAIKNAKAQIDIQLDVRFKKFEGLINVVKQAMDYEKTTLKDVVELRNRSLSAQSNGDTKGAIEAENQISKIVSSLNLVFEAYPDLKANTNALQLQEEIVSTENKLGFAKQAYNDSIELFNIFKSSVPTNIIANMFAVFKNEYPYWELDEATSKEKENYTVKFS